MCSQLHVHLTCKNFEHPYSQNISEGISQPRFLVLLQIGIEYFADYVADNQIICFAMDLGEARPG